MNITEKEEVIIQAVAQNGMNTANYGEPEDASETATWVNCLDDCELLPGQEYPVPSSVPGIVASLSKKGLVRTDGEVIELSPEGFTEWRRLKDEHKARG